MKTKNNGSGFYCALIYALISLFIFLIGNFKLVGDAFNDITYDIIAIVGLICWVFSINWADRSYNNLLERISQLERKIDTLTNCPDKMEPNPFAGKLSDWTDFISTKEDE